jgi:flagellar basal body-associated protein FliL
MVERTSSPDSISRRRARWLKMIGLIVLALGLGGAGLIYWLGTRSPDVMNDLSMVGYNKAQRRQMGQLYGKMGTFTEDLYDDLKRPSTQAKIIVGISALIAASCFYFGQLPNKDDRPR